MKHSTTWTALAAASALLLCAGCTCSARVDLPAEQWRVLRSGRACVPWEAYELRIDESFAWPTHPDGEVAYRVEVKPPGQTTWYTARTWPLTEGERFSLHAPLNQLMGNRRNMASLQSDLVLRPEALARLGRNLALTRFRLAPVILASGGIKRLYSPVGEKVAERIRWSWEPEEDGFVFPEEEGEGGEPEKAEEGEQTPEERAQEKLKRLIEHLCERLGADHPVCKALRSRLEGRIHVRCRLSGAEGFVRIAKDEDKDKDEGADEEAEEGDGGEAGEEDEGAAGDDQHGEGHPVGFGDIVLDGEHLLQHEACALGTLVHEGTHAADVDAGRVPTPLTWIQAECRGYRAAWEAGKAGHLGEDPEKVLRWIKIDMLAFLEEVRRLWALVRPVLPLEPKEEVCRCLNEVIAFVDGWDELQAVLRANEKDFLSEEAGNPGDTVVATIYEELVAVRDLVCPR